MYSIFDKHGVFNFSHSSWAHTSMTFALVSCVNPNTCGSPVPV